MAFSYSLVFSFVYGWEVWMNAAINKLLSFKKDILRHMVFWLKFSVSSANTRVKDKKLLLFTFFWGLSSHEASKPSSELWTLTHDTWQKAGTTPRSPLMGTFYFSTQGTDIFLSLTEIAKSRFELWMFHLPFEGHWSHQCHIQTGRNPARQWRQWKPRSRWSVEKETQGWETRGKVSYPSTITL